MLGHKTNLNKITVCNHLNIESNHNGMKLEISNSKKFEENTHKYIEIKQHIPKHPWGQIKRELRKYF